MTTIQYKGRTIKVINVRGLRERFFIRVNGKDLLVANFRGSKMAKQIERAKQTIDSEDAAQ
jgi:hypothetical protein